MDYKAIFGAASIVLAILAYLPYIRDVLKRTTTPHALSWLVWSIMSAIGFAAQITHGAGAGAWLNGLTTFTTFGTFLLARKYGEKNILLVDWMCLAATGVALIFWAITSTPLLSIILISLADIIGGFFPTLRKSYRKPYSETALMYLLYAASLICSLLALREINLINSLYTATFLVVNILVVAYLWARRWQLKAGRVWLP